MILYFVFHDLLKQHVLGLFKEKILCLIKKKIHKDFFKFFTMIILI